MNVVYSLSAYPVGHFSDKIRREWFLVAGLVVLFLSDLVLSFAKGLPFAFFGIVLWGLHMGLTQGTLATVIVDNCTPDRRGTAFGLFNLFSAAALLLASIIAGILWDHIGPRATFLAGAGFSLISLIVFLLTRHFME